MSTATEIAVPDSLVDALLRRESAGQPFTSRMVRVRNDDVHVWSGLFRHTVRSVGGAFDDMVKSEDETREVVRTLLSLLAAQCLDQHGWPGVLRYWFVGDARPSATTDMYAAADIAAFYVQPILADAGIEE